MHDTNFKLYVFPRWYGFITSYISNITLLVLEGNWIFGLDPLWLTFDVFVNCGFEGSYAYMNLVLSAKDSIILLVAALNYRLI